ncbi:hypothetical protein [Thermophilibacter provencensis]|uniref:hypothetical protein n=1 Tax=Thermophilibacter provencensis TaxID=1852386 RepID=UPI003AA8A70A
MGLGRLREAGEERGKHEADREERTRGEKGYTTWQASIRIEDKEKLRRWAREDNVRMAELLRKMIEREERRRRRKARG